ncbi:MAG: class I SAM-dependent methyltransferase, partial [Bacilli bacterium]|nr:class I SAM-dependent methyltransferase [Bacilli bacterium]
KIKNIKFVQGDENYLKSLPDSSFDGIFCSNFLDVVPASISEVVIKEMLRIIKPKGFILLKFNFVLNPELIEKLHMVEIEKNTYTMNGVVRAMNRSTEEWVSLFIDCDVVRIGEFARAPGLPNDRVILLQKK